MRSAGWVLGSDSAVVATAAAVARGAAAGAAVGVGGTGGLVGREGGGAGARRVGGFMWLLVLQHPRDALCLFSQERNFSQVGDISQVFSQERDFPTRKGGEHNLWHQVEPWLTARYDAYNVQIENKMSGLTYTDVQPNSTD